MIYLNYWTPKGHCKRKKFKTVEEARKFGVKLRKKEGYIVMKYGCIHAYKPNGEATTIRVFDVQYSGSYLGHSSAVTNGC